MEKTQNYMKMLKREVINFPDFLQEQKMKNFMSYYKKNTLNSFKNNIIENLIVLIIN